jgi:hypothetical protein
MNGVRCQEIKASLSREQAIRIAQIHAKLRPQSYYAEPFQPHEWVIEAIIAAAAPPLHALAPATVSSITSTGRRWATH